MISLQINAGGAASRCGEFRVGQRIIDVNGNTLLGATHHEAVRVLKSVGKDVKFIVCDGYEPPEDGEYEHERGELLVCWEHCMFSLFHKM